MLLAYKLKEDSCQKLPKVQIFHHYITDVFKLLPASNYQIIARFQIFEGDFSSSWSQILFLSYFFG